MGTRVKAWLEERNESPRVARGMVKLAGGWRQLGPAWTAGARRGKAQAGSAGAGPTRRIGRALKLRGRDTPAEARACWGRVRDGVGKAGELGPTGNRLGFGLCGSSLFLACAARLTRLWA